MKNTITFDLENKTVRKQFRSRIACVKEAAILNTLGGSGLVPRLLQFSDFALTMSLVEGKTLSEILGGDCSMMEATDLLLKVADRLAQLQSQVIQSLGKYIILDDLNPRNIMVTDEGTVVFIDFEAVRLLSFAELKGGLYVQNFASLISMIRSFKFADENMNGAMERVILASLSGVIDENNPAGLHLVMEESALCDQKSCHYRSLKKYLKNTDAFIAAGGLSTRMGGFPKGFMKLDNFTFCDHIIYALQRFDDLAFSANLPEYNQFGLQIYPDEFKEIGPISAIYTALKNTQKDYAFICPCDMPYVDEAAIFEPLQPEMFAADAILYRNDHSLVPVLGFYNKRVLPKVEEMIEKGDRKLMHLLEGLKVVEITPEDLSKFRNINSPEDLN